MIQIILAFMPGPCCHRPDVCERLVSLRNVLMHRGIVEVCSGVTARRGDQSVTSPSRNRRNETRTSLKDPAVTLLLLHREEGIPGGGGGKR